MAYRRSSARRGRASSTRRSYSGTRGRSTRKASPKRSRGGTRKASGRGFGGTLKIVVEHAMPTDMVRPAGAGTVTKQKTKSRF